MAKLPKAECSTTVSGGDPEIQMEQKLCCEARGPFARAVARRTKEENRELVWPLLLRGCPGTGRGFLDPSPSPPRPLPKVLHACVLQDKLLLRSSHRLGSRGQGDDYKEKWEPFFQELVFT